MNKKDLLSAIKSGRVSRRDMMMMMSAAGVGMAVLPVRHARAADEAINFTWEGYNEPGFHPGYTAKYGAEPEGPYFADVGVLSFTAWSRNCSSCGMPRPSVQRLTELYIPIVWTISTICGSV